LIAGTPAPISGEGESDRKHEAHFPFRAAWHEKDPMSPLGSWSTISEDSSVYSIACILPLIIIITFDFYGPVGLDLTQDRRIISRREKQQAFN
jgi:hypothetical protein